MLAFYVKLGALLVKQISKPLASVLKSQAVAHPSLREVLTKIGQRMHEYNLRVTQQLKTDGELATGRKARALAPITSACEARRPAPHFTHLSMKSSFAPRPGRELSASRTA